MTKPPLTTRQSRHRPTERRTRWWRYAEDGCVTYVIERATDRHIYQIGEMFYADTPRQYIATSIRRARHNLASIVVTPR